MAKNSFLSEIANNLLFWDPPYAQGSVYSERLEVVDWGEGPFSTSN